MDTREDLLKTYHPSRQTPKEVVKATELVMDAMYWNGCPVGTYSKVHALCGHTLPKGILVYGDNDGLLYKYKGTKVINPEADVYDSNGTGSSWVLVSACDSVQGLPEPETTSRHLYSTSFDFPVIGDSSDVFVEAARTAIENDQILVMVARDEPYVFNKTANVDVASNEEARVVIDGGATIKAGPGLDKPVLQFVGDYSGHLDISGSGTIDCSQGTHVVGVQSNTGLAANNLETLSVRGLNFYAGEDWFTATGDSGITCGGCKSISITDNCRFQGWPDLGIYLTGDNDIFTDSGDGYTALISGCYFYRNKNDISTKRLHNGCKIIGNHFKESEIGVSSFVGSGILPGKNMVITGNTFQRTARPVSVRLSDNAVVSGNHFLNWGVLFTGLDLGSNLRAVQVQGSLNCDISGNVYDCSDTDPSYAIEIGDYTYNGVSYPGGGCRIDGTLRGVGNTRAFADINASVPSVVTTVETDMSTIVSGYNPSTVVDRFITNLGTRYIYKGGAISLTI